MNEKLKYQITLFARANDLDGMFKTNYNSANIDE